MNATQPKEQDIGSAPTFAGLLSQAASNGYAYAAVLDAVVKHTSCHELSDSLEVVANRVREEADALASYGALSAKYGLFKNESRQSDSGADLIRIGVDGGWSVASIFRNLPKPPTPEPTQRKEQEDMEALNDHAAQTIITERVKRALRLRASKPTDSTIEWMVEETLYQCRRELHNVGHVTLPGLGTLATDAAGRIHFAEGGSIPDPDDKPDPDLEAATDQFCSTEYAWAQVRFCINLEPNRNIEVEGEAIGEGLAVHRSHKAREQKWCVSDMTTGLAIGGSFTDPKVAELFVKGGLLSLAKHKGTSVSALLADLRANAKQVESSP